MGGRGYHNDVRGYLNGNKRTVEFKAAYKSSDGMFDILFDTVAPQAPTMPMFSNTAGKIYAIVDKRGERIKSIGFYDQTHRLIKTIHLDHFDNNYWWHVHEGDAYHHSSGNARDLTEEERKTVEKILKVWKSKGGR